MKIEKICSKCIEAVKDARYNESTIFNYYGLIRRFKQFCEERSVTDYSSEIGKQYSEDVVSKKIGKFSANRYYTQGRFYRLIDSYFKNSCFDLSNEKKGKLSLEDMQYQMHYERYKSYLKSSYENINTIHFYEYGMYCFLKYLSQIFIDLEAVSSKSVIEYIKQTKQSRLRAVLCELRNIFRYINRKDLITAIAGIRATRINRIIPVLTDEEMSKIENSISKNLVSKRDAAIVVTGLSCGIRASDLVKLRLRDIDWNNDTISFKQNKTGNIVCLPLTPSVGNLLALYITEERPKSENDIIFLRLFAPFQPFSDHSALYAIVKKVFIISGIEKNNRIFGTHMLRHNAASSMVKNGVPIETIAAVLGHASPDTTDIYITTDKLKLKECVLPLDLISKEVH